MTIILNDIPTEVDDILTVAALAAMQNLGASGSAIAVNDTVIRRADWETTLLKSGDKVLIIKAAYGG